MSYSRPLPSVTVNGQKVAVFKDPSSKPYGGFANTTKAGVYPVTQQVKVHNESLTFKWPSSEHAYHAQKLLHLKSKLPANDPRQKILTDTLRTIESTKARPGEEFMPRDDFDPIINAMITRNPGQFGNDKRAFDKLCDADYHSKHNPTGGLNPSTGKPFTHDFMREVLKLKLEQNPELRETAMQMAREGVIPIEYSRYDYNWASGPDGSGSNMLGIMLLEEGNRLLRAIRETPKLPDPQAAYNGMKAQNMQALSHDALHNHSKAMKQVSTAQPQAYRQTQGQTQPSPSSGRQTPTEYILSKTGNQYGIKDLKVKADANIQGQSVVHLNFNSPKDAQAFVAKMKGKNIHLLARGDNVFLAQDKQQNVFNALGVGNYGRNNPQPIASVLLQQQMSAQTQRAAPPPVTPPAQPQQPSAQRQTGTDIDRRAQQARYNRIQHQNPKAIVQNTARKPIPKSIPIPQCIAGQSSYSIQNVTAASIDVGPKRTAIKLTFESAEALDIARHSLETAGAKVAIDTSNPKAGPTLSFLGDVKSLEKAVKDVGKLDLLEHEEANRPTKR